MNMRALVSAPGMRRAAHGLVESGARVSTSERWERGVSFTPEGCMVLFGHSPDCPTGQWSDFQECTLVEADPWIIEASLAWATADLAANPKDMLRRALDIGTSSVLERLTSSGVTNVTGALTPSAPSGTVSVGGVRGRAAGIAPPTLIGVAQPASGSQAGSPLASVGQAETKLLDAADHVGGAGTLLMSPLMATAASQAFEEHDGKLYTKATGSLVIVGNFEPADVVYAVTGDVDVYLSDIEITETFEHRSNEIILHGSRYALAVFATCAAFSTGVSAVGWDGTDWGAGTWA